MQDIVIPPPIDVLVKAINEGDTDRLLALFAPGATVDDWGSKYIGLDQIRVWNDRELIGAKGVLTVRSAERQGDRVVLVTDWRSNFFTGPGRFVFTLEDGRIRHWKIAAL